MKPIIFLPLAGLLLSGPALAAESPQALQDQFLDSMRANDAAGIAACYAPDAVSYTVGTLVVNGPDGVKADWQKVFEDTEVTAAQLVDVHSETHGDTAVSWGEWQLTVQPRAGGEPMQMVGRFSDVARNFDGNWLYVMDHASMPLPPPPDEAPADDASD